MSQKSIDLANANLEPGDKTQYVFDVQHNGKCGLVVLSRKKIQFVEEHGFINKTANLIFNDNYKDIGKVEVKGNQVTIKNNNGSTYTLKTENREASDSLGTKLQDLLNQST